MIKIKPFTDYSEHEVINLFALNATSGDRGNFVKIVGSGWTNTAGTIGFAGAALPGNPVGITDFYAPRWETKAQVKLGASGEKAFGILLLDVRATTQFGEAAIYDKQWLLDNQAVVSGKTVPILRKGLVLVSGVSGTPVIGSGAKVSDSGAGEWMLCNIADTASVGEFIGAQDAQGFSLFSLNCY